MKAVFIQIVTVEKLADTINTITSVRNVAMNQLAYFPIAYATTKTLFLVKFEINVKLVRQLVLAKIRIACAIMEEVSEPQMQWKIIFILFNLNAVFFSVDCSFKNMTQHQTNAKNVRLAPQACIRNVSALMVDYLMMRNVFTVHGMHPDRMETAFVVKVEHI